MPSQPKNDISREGETPVTTRTIVEGMEVPELGFGSAPLGNEYGAFDDDDVQLTVNMAIDAGVTLFDTSPYYGRTLAESRLGAALGRRREEIVLCTKAGRYGLSLPDGFDFSPTRLVESAEQSMVRLGTDYLDILLLHDIEFSAPEPILECAIPVLQDLKAQGKVRAIGVSSYRLDVLTRVIAESDVDVVLTYCHSDLVNDSAVSVLAPVAASHRTAVLHGSPLHMGLLTPSGGPPWHPAPAQARERAELIRRACADQGVSITAAALSFALSLSVQASTILGVSTPDELRHNIDVAGKPVPPSILETIRAAASQIALTEWPSGIWPESDVR